ncbi:MAG: EamA family transporter [Bacteroidales bacterium]|nr:EamA family transporter [Bacteroidales bacterium]MBQ1717991.1 EamA family transporter [Bacteroidales bacterium]MBQ2543762.1 EamA family transporter [Bacteroidales bacterium]
MWVLLAVFSAILLGTYDVAKKQALRKNGTFAVLLVATALSTLFVSPFLRIGPAEDHLKLALKAVLVTASWVSGMEGLKRLPLTTVSTIKGSRPVFVVLFSIILFGERLNWMQWLGIAIVLGALYMLGFTSRRDASAQVRKTGFIWMGISVLTGVASALYDKYIMKGMEPMFVQSWTNLFITIILALCVLVKRLQARSDKFRWDWTLVLVAVLITGADALYFFALKQPDALLSIISVVRRASVLVTFVLGAIIFHEGNIRAKGLNMLLMAAGVVLLLIGS